MIGYRSGVGILSLFSSDIYDMNYMIMIDDSDSAIDDLYNIDRFCRFDNTILIGSSGYDERRFSGNRMIEKEKR
jgi:hypothetical protein